MRLPEFTLFYSIMPGAGDLREFRRSPALGVPETDFKGLIP